MPAKDVKPSCRAGAVRSTRRKNEASIHPVLSLPTRDCSVNVPGFLPQSFPCSEFKNWICWILLEINQFKLCSLSVNKYLLRVHILPQTEASL